MRKSAFELSFGWIVLGVLLAVCFLAYNNSLHNPFMMDDRHAFSDVKFKNIKFLLNSFIIPVQGLSQGDAFSTSLNYYRPMAYVISFLFYQAFGNEPFGYHVLNLVLFTLMCFTLYVFIDLFFKDKVLAFVASVLFAVHPINIFYVDYITSGIHSVRFICMLLSLIFFLRTAEGAHRYIYYLLSLICFAVTLLCHETSIVLPFYILFVSIFVSKSSIQEASLKTWPFFLTLLIFLFFRFSCTRIPGHLSADLVHLDPQRIILITAAFSKLIYLYFTKLLMPSFISFDWNVLLMTRSVQIIIWLSGLLFLLWGWYLLLRGHAKSIPFFCATWIMLGFLPVTLASMYKPDLGLLLEPQWLTFSSLGFFLFVAWAGLGLYARLNKWIIGLMFVFLLLGWGIITRHNNWIWGDEIRYDDYWLENVEGGNPHMDDITLAELYLYKKDYKLARYYYQKVADSDDPEKAASAYNNLGVLDIRQGNIKRAKEEFLSSFKKDPRNFSTLNSLAVIYISQSNYRSAKQYLLRALELNKYSMEARLNLAFILDKESNYGEAIRIYEQNLNIVPNEEKSLLSLIQIYVHLGDTKDVRAYSQLLINNNKSPIILTELGSILAQFGQSSMALDAFSQAMRLDPKYNLAYLEAGKLMANAHMYTEAIRIWQIGQEIDPHDQSFNDNISKAMALKSIPH